jgi:hypothetical protein
MTIETQLASPAQPITLPLHTTDDLVQFSISHSGNIGKVSMTTTQQCEFILRGQTNPFQSVTLVDKDNPSNTFCWDVNETYNAPAEGTYKLYSNTAACATRVATSDCTTTPPNGKLTVTPSTQVPATP